MPRFVRTVPEIPSRSAINPFTKQAVTFPGRPAYEVVFECEVVGRVLHTAKGVGGQPLATSKRELEDEDAAFLAMAVLCRKKKRGGFREAGASDALAPLLGGDTSLPPPSALMLDAAFEGGDDRFVTELFRFRSVEKVASYAERWLADTRPWARSALLSYIDDGCDRDGHKALVKRLFKGAEAKRDDELMAHFMVAFDHMIVRRFERRRRAATKATKFRKARPAGFQIVDDPFVVGHLAIDDDGKHERSLRFSRVTRRYLARRAWRYFRHLGYADVERHGVAVRAALGLYDDADLRTPLRILDAWGLMNALYARSPVLDRSGSGIRVVPGRSLAELEVAPRFPAAFEGVFGELVPLLAVAKAKLVRHALVSILKGQYQSELAALGIGRLRILLESPHEEAQALGVELLPRAGGGEHITMEEWLRLLRITSPTVLVAVCDAVRAWARPSQLSLEDVMTLLSSPLAPIAELALPWFEARVRESALAGGNDLRSFLRARDAAVAGVRSRAMSLLLEGMTREGKALTFDVARDLVDANHADVRALGLLAIEKTPTLQGDAQLFLALSESPYPDVRAIAIRHAKAWLTRDGGASKVTLHRLYASVILSVHGGSRAKASAVRQVADAIAADATRAAELVPLLAIALRSVRGPERAMGLAGLARSALGNPSARAALAAAAPELRLGEVASQ